jgi:dipeptidyl aminopeptidase/acylaminoacyl peptidase
MAGREQTTDSGNKVLWIVLAIVGGFLLLALAACGGLVFLGYRAMTQIMGDPQVATPGLEPQDEDYAEARKQFLTKLIRQGPSWQSWKKLTPPAGVSEVEYPSGNLRLKAWINRPTDADKRKHPAVLFIHGGFAFDETDWAMPQPYREAGFIVMTPILRGENGQVGNYTLFYDEVNDVLAAADCLAQQPGVDPEQIYVAGHSAGGTLTLLAALTSKRFKAAASFSGSPDNIQFTRSNNAQVPFDQSDIRELRMRSPVAYPSSFKCPVRLYYGTLELPFRASSERTAMLAKQHGLDVEAVSVPGEHFTEVPAAMRQSIDFFKGVLAKRPAAVPAPTEPAQSRRPPSKPAR